MTDTPTSWIVAFGALLSGSGGKLVYDVYKIYKTGGPKELKPLAIVDANLSAVVRARDEVIEDNVRLRQERVEQDERHAAERAVWKADQDRLRADVARLEAQIRVERDDAARRYDALLQQIQHLGARTDQLRDGN